MTSRILLGALLTVATACWETEPSVAGKTDAQSSSTGGGSSGGVSGNAGASAGGASGTSGGSGGNAGSAQGGSSGTRTVDSGVPGCRQCPLGSLCVEHQTVGGALMLPDAGRCPDGRILSPGPRPTCDLPPSYECETLPSECMNAPGTPALAHCVCARSLCPAGNQCTDVSPTLMKCTLLAP